MLCDCVEVCFVRRNFYQRSVASSTELFYFPSVHCLCLLSSRKGMQPVSDPTQAVIKVFPVI